MLFVICYLVSICYKIYDLIRSKEYWLVKKNEIYKMRKTVDSITL